jgi:serine/threonine-protein kinase
MTKAWAAKWKIDDSLPQKSGGQGAVSKLIHLTDGSLGALKEMHPESQRDSERRRRMAREILSMQAVKHPSIPQVIEHNIEAVKNLEIGLYVITEWVDGHTLSEKLSGKPVSIDQALAYIRPLCEAVRACHEEEVIHRDIKPDNVIVVSGSEKIYLVDFGTAWAGSDDSGFDTEAGQELGNRFLRMPDLAAGRPRRDLRVDVTFLVGVLFFLVTGRAPRVLVDQAQRRPHEAMADKLPRSLTTDPRWIRLRRIFDVGFHAAVEYRFQVVDDLLARLEDLQCCLTPRVTETKTQEAVQSLNSVLSSIVAQTIIENETIILRFSRNLEESLRTLAIENGLQSIHNAGNAWVSQPGRQVQFTYTLVRKDAVQPRVLMTHEVTIMDANVRAGFRVDGGAMRFYYTGPAVDHGRLEEEMKQQADAIFSEVVINLENKIRGLLLPSRLEELLGE